MVIKLENTSKDYKTTDLGDIPQSWNVYRLDELASKILDGTHATPTYVETGIKFLSVENITKNDYVNTKYVTLDAHKEYSKRCKVEKDDILMTRIGSIGNAKLVDWDFESSIYVSLALIKLKNKKQAKYISHYMKSDIFKKEILKRSLLNAAPMKINLGEVGKVAVILPSLEEQQKIAEILSATDEQIEKTEQLIKKTKELKKGLMQQLLIKGIGHTEFKQTELGEIPIEWEIVKQGNIATFFNGRAYKQTEFTESGTQIIRIQNLTGGKNYVYSDMELDANKYAEKDDLIYAWSATFGPYIWKGPRSIYHYHIWKIEVDENLLDKYFFFYRLDYISVEMHSQKNGSAFAHLTKGGMENHAIPLPPLNEQKRIAEILLSVDEQIEIYEKEKEKQIELKRALMQKLLTGKLRVTV